MPPIPSINKNFTSMRSEKEGIIAEKEVIGSMSASPQITSKDHKETNHITSANKMNDDVISPCHICNLEIPTMYLKEHKKSGKHLTLAKLADNAFQRVLKQIKVKEEKDCPATNDSSIYYCDICNIGVEKTLKETHGKDLKHITLAKRDTLIVNLLEIYTDPTSSLIQKSDQNKPIKSQDIYNKAITESTEIDIQTKNTDQSGERNNVNRNDKDKIKKNNASELLNKGDIPQDDCASRLKHTESVNKIKARQAFANNNLNMPEEKGKLIKMTTENNDHNQNACKTVQDNNSVITERNEKEIKVNKTKNTDKPFAKTQTNQENGKKVIRDEAIDTDIQHIPKNNLVTAQNLNPQSSNTFKVEAIDEDFIKLTTATGDTYKIPLDNWHSVFYKPGPLPGSRYFDCQVCMKSFQPVTGLSSHKASKKHLEILQMPILDEHCIRKVYNWNHCLLCNVLVIKLEQHIITEKHQELLRKFTIPKNFNVTGNTIKTKLNVNETTKVAENVRIVKKEHNIKNTFNDNNETSWRNKETTLDEQNEMKSKINQDMLRKNEQDFGRLKINNISWRKEAGADPRNKKGSNEETSKENLGQGNANWRNKETIPDCRMRSDGKPETSTNKANDDKLKKEMMKNIEDGFEKVNANKTNLRDDEKDLHSKMKSNENERTVKTTDANEVKKQIMTSIREDFAKLNASNYNLVQDPIAQVLCDKNSERSLRTELLKITEVKTMNGDVLKVAKKNWHGLIMDNYGHSGMNCLICERFVTENDLQAHIDSTQHANKIKVPIDNADSLRVIAYNEAHCILCNEILFDFTREDLEKHVLSKEHLRFLHGALVVNR